MSQRLRLQGSFPETHETFIGTYWGLVSTPCTAEIVESASTYIIVGPLFNDYNTVAFTLLLDESEAFAPAHDATHINVQGTETAFTRQTGCEHVWLDQKLACLCIALKHSSRWADIIQWPE